MARIFSWQISSSTISAFSYLAKVDGTKQWFSATTQVSDQGVLKKISDAVNLYSEEEYRTQFDSMKAWALGYNVYLDPYTSYFNVGGCVLMLTGIQGPEGKQGEKGQKGDQGTTGVAGKGRNIMCFASGSTSGAAPTIDNIKGGYFDPDNWVITYPTDPTGDFTWGDSDEYPDGVKVYMSNANFGNEPGGPINGWATPICISGPKGDNGADGENIEYVYQRTTDRTKEPSPNPPTGTTEEEAKNQGWTDHPMGIGVDSGTGIFYKAEWISYHTKISGTTGWTSWSNAALWSSWGEDGTDGDGIEYIYAVTSGNNPTEITKTIPSTVSYGGELAAKWQEPEIWDYIKASGLTSHYEPWTDNPSDVSSGEPYEWVCIRRRKWDTTQEKGVFGEFESPKIWAHWGKDGDTKFISFVYALLPEGVEEMSGITPTGGSFASPIPTAPTGVTHKGKTYSITWTDGPTGGGNGKALWMSKAVFDSATPSSPIAPGWSTPTLLADTEDFEVMYGSFTGTPNPMPTGFTKVGVTIDATWYATAKAAGWYDDVDEATAATHSAVTHQAQIKGKNNKFNDGDWQIFKVKGEDGQSGKSDVDWLKDVFGSGVTVNPDEAALKGLIGVVDSAKNVKAFMNGKSAYSSATDGTLMIAAGVEGMSDPNTAKFRVYENGTIYAKNANIQGTVNATNGYIGGIEIGAGGLSSANFSLSNDGKVTASDININNDNITIDNSGIVFKNAGLPALSVNAKTYNSSSEWITTGSTTSTSYSAITVWSGQGTNVVQKGEEWQWSTSEETPYIISAGTLNISSYSKLKITGTTKYYLAPYGVTGGSTNVRASINSNICFNFKSGDTYYDIWENRGLNNYTDATIYSSITFTKEILIPAGTYNFNIYNQTTLGMMVIPQLPDTAGTYSGKWEIEITGLTIEVLPQQDYTEIFKNGFGTKADANNYFFVCKDSTDNKITFEVVSDGKKMILDETGLKLAPKKLTKITGNGIGLSSCTKYEEIIWEVPADHSEIILPSSANMKDGEIIYLNTNGNIYKLKCSSRTWIGVGDTRGWYGSGDYSPNIGGVTVVKIMRMGTDIYVFISRYP